MRTGGLAVALCVLAGCSPLQPLQPSAPPDVPVTVRVLEYADQHTPIVQATVRADSGDQQVTDTSGTALLHVPCDRDVAIDVAAPGYVGFGATDRIPRPQTWTFWLERRP